MEDSKLAIRTGNRGLQLHSLDEMQRWAEGVKASGLAPESLKTTAQILVATQYGLELGLTPMAALSSICVVRGKPTLYGDAALAQVKNSGICEYVKEQVDGIGDKMTATVESKRKDTGEIVTTTFDVADAKQAKLWGKSGPWSSHPKRMLKYKARAFNLRDNFPDVLMGMHITEEFYGEDERTPTMPTPDCSTPSRNERKKVESIETPPADTEGFTDDEAGGNFESEVNHESTD